jgi:hypothetical protein
MLLDTKLVEEEYDYEDINPATNVVLEKGKITFK